MRECNKNVIPDITLRASTCPPHHSFSGQTFSRLPRCSMSRELKNVNEAAVKFIRRLKKIHAALLYFTRRIHTRTHHILYIFGVFLTYSPVTERETSLRKICIYRGPPLLSEYAGVQKKSFYFIKADYPGILIYTFRLTGGGTQVHQLVQNSGKSLQIYVFIYHKTRVISKRKTKLENPKLLCSVIYFETK